MLNISGNHSRCFFHDAIMAQMVLITSIHLAAHNTDYDVITRAGLVSSSWSHHGALHFSQSKHSNYRRCQSLSDVASVINPAHWTQDIRHEHTCRGVKSSPSCPGLLFNQLPPLGSNGNPFCVARCCLSCYSSGNICPVQPTEF